MESAAVESRPKRTSHLSGCVGFWLWALVGAGFVFAFVSFIGFVVAIPAAAIAVILNRRSRWKDGPVLLGMLTGAGVPLLLVAGLQWNSWHHRVLGDNTPNPYEWGGVGLCLVVAGIVAYAVNDRRT